MADSLPQPNLESTIRLLDRAKLGDAQAVEDLFARFLPILRRWARGRLPAYARDIADTQDVVQDVLVQTFKRLDGFDPRGVGALQAYLRQAILNRIRDELRKRGRRGGHDELDSRVPDDAPSPLEEAIGAEALGRYEQAMTQLKPDDREAIVLRIEMGCSYEEIAEWLSKPSVGAARKAVERAILRLAQALTHVEARPPSSGD